MKQNVNKIYYWCFFLMQIKAQGDQNAIFIGRILL